MAKKPKTNSTSKKKSKSFRENYRSQRDRFFSDHPKSRALLGILIVSFAIFLGVYLYNQIYAKIFVGLTLDQYGVDYPYSDLPPLKK